MTTAPTAMTVIRNAHENRQADELLDLIADDAVLTEHRMDDIANPRVARGKDEIASVVEDLMSRDMAHQVMDAVATGDRIAYTVWCEYPEGGKVLGSYTLDLDADGLISRIAGHVSWTE